MKNLRTLASAAVIGAFILGAVTIHDGRLQAAGKKDGGDGQSATCAYLLNVINYPYVSPIIKVTATSLYISLGCQPALP